MLLQRRSDFAGEVRRINSACVSRSAPAPALSAACSGLDAWGAGVTVENAARLSAGQVDHDQRALGAGIGQLGMTTIRAEPYVVDIRAGRRDILVEVDDLRDPVRRKIEPHQLGAARHDIALPRRCGISYPEVPPVIGDDALHADEMVAGRNLILLGVPPAAPARDQIGADPTVRSAYGNRDRRILCPALKA
nr:hypothetical protein [Sphingomonas phyllosphaerae]